MNEKVIVTGGAGFIGSHLVDLLISKDFSVVVMDNLSTGKRSNLNLRAKFYEVDLTNFEEVDKIFAEESPDYVFHLAAHINVRDSIKSPIFDARQNILNSLNLLELSVKHEIKHFIFSSTGGAIYGDNAEIPTKESSEAKPQTPYGCSKCAVEKYLRFYHKVYGLKFTCLRYSNVYGPRQNSQGEAGVISIFFDKLFSGENPIIFGGIQTRDFIFVGDVARANLMALEDPKSHIYNVCTSKETDIIEVFNKINKYFKNKFQPDFKELIVGEQKRSCLSFSKIKELLGWSPRTALEDGLDRTYCYFLRERMKDKKK